MKIKLSNNKLEINVDKFGRNKNYDFYSKLSGTGEIELEQQSKNTKKTMQTRKTNKTNRFFKTENDKSFKDQLMKQYVHTDLENKSHQLSISPQFQTFIKKTNKYGFNFEVDSEKEKGKYKPSLTKSHNPIFLLASEKVVNPQTKKKKVEFDSTKNQNIEYNPNIHDSIVYLETQTSSGGGGIKSDFHINNLNTKNNEEFNQFLKNRMLYYKQDLHDVDFHAKIYDSLILTSKKSTNYEINNKIDSLKNHLIDGVELSRVEKEKIKKIMHLHPYAISSLSYLVDESSNKENKLKEEALKKFFEGTDLEGGFGQEITNKLSNKFSRSKVDDTKRLDALTRITKDVVNEMKDVIPFHLKTENFKAQQNKNATNSISNQQTQNLTKSPPNLKKSGIGKEIIHNKINSAFSEENMSQFSKKNIDKNKIHCVNDFNSPDSNVKVGVDQKAYDNPYESFMFLKNNIKINKEIEQAYLKKSYIARYEYFNNIKKKLVIDEKNSKYVKVTANYKNKKDMGYGDTAYMNFNKSKDKYNTTGTTLSLVNVTANLTARSNDKSNTNKERGENLHDSSKVLETVAGKRNSINLNSSGEKFNKTTQKGTTQNIIKNNISTSNMNIQETNTSNQDLHVNNTNVIKSSEKDRLFEKNSKMHFLFFNNFPDFLYIPVNLNGKTDIFCYFKYSYKNFPAGREQFSFYTDGEDYILYGGLSSDKKSIVWGFNPGRLFYFLY